MNATGIVAAGVTLAAEVVRRLPSPELLEGQRHGGLVRRARRLSRRSQEARRRRARLRAADRLAGLLVTLRHLGIDADLPGRER